MDPTAILFVPLLALTALAIFFLSCFLARHFLVVLQSTAAGAEQVVWPDEPFLDWFWQLFYMAIMVGLWVGPGLLLGRFLVESDVPMPVTCAGVMWFGLPISLLSSLSSGSQWVPFAPSLLHRFAQRFGALLQFYVLSAPLVAGIGWAGMRLFARVGPEGMGGLVLAAVTLPVAWLAYAHLLGRFALILSFTDDPGQPKKKPAPKVRQAEAEPQEEEEPPPRATEVNDPWDAPPSVIDDEPMADEEVRVDDADLVEDEEVPAYGVAEESAPVRAEPVEAPPRRRPKRKSRRREDVLKEPRALFEAPAVAFLAEPGCIRSVFILGIGSFLLGNLVNFLFALWPV